MADPYPDKTDVPGEAAGDVIDRYKLLEEIGAGGMGTVWMAQQSQPVKRKVALKIIKLGMDTVEVVVRFEAERQALALMEHPHIARVLDGGATASGRPFFVMELVRGTPITEYCDRAKLGLRERLELFAKVCEAIQHAHLKGVIHRDIKPTNVLVALHDGVPVPKVIDFGIAKATSAELTQKTLFTQFAQIVGTPEYMAPEQAEMSGLDIDTRADVYSLGVLLYELLTGTVPIEARAALEAGYEELLRAIREVDPAKPSTRVSTMGAEAAPIAANRHVDVESLSKRLRGDLDWIVMKALEKDRTRRYETASGFAADVVRYLDGEPVLAAPPSVGYRLRKFVGKHVRTVAAVATIALLVVAGSVGTGVGWWRTARANRSLDAALASETEQRERAERNESRALEAEAAARAEAERANEAEREASRRAAELDHVAAFQAEQLGRLDTGRMGVRLRQLLFDRVGEGRRQALVEGVSDLNFTDLSLRLLEENLFDETIRAIDAQFVEQPLVRARLLHAMGATLFALGTTRKAAESSERAVALRRAELGDEDPDTLASVANLGVHLLWSGEPEDAGRLTREALDARRRVLGDEHPDTLESLRNLGDQRNYEGDLEAAERHYRAALDARRRTLGDEHPATLESMHVLGNLLLVRAASGEAEALHREALEARRRTLGDEHPDTLASLLALGVALRDADPASSERLLQDAIAIHRRVLGSEHPRTLGAISSLAARRLAGRDLPEAEALFGEVLEGWSRIAGSEHPSTQTARIDMGRTLAAQGRLSHAEAHFRAVLASPGRAREDGAPYVSEAAGELGELLARQRRLPEAETYLREALDGLRPGLGDDHPQTLALIARLGNALRDQGKLADAEPLVREALDGRRRTLGEDHPATLVSIAALGGLLHLRGQPDEAEAYLREALDGMRRTLGDDHPQTLAALANLGASLAASGQLHEAEPFLREALEVHRRILGVEHATTMASLHSLGSVYVDLGEWERAERYRGEELDVRRRVLGDLDPSTLDSLHLLGDLLAKLQRYADAEPFLAEALEGRRRMLGDDHPDTERTLHLLVGVLEALGEPARAAEWRERLGERGAEQH